MDHYESQRRRETSIDATLKATAKMAAPSQSATPFRRYDSTIQTRPPTTPPAIPHRIDFSIRIRSTADYIVTIL